MKLKINFLFVFVFLTIQIHAQNNLFSTYYDVSNKIIAQSLKDSSAYSRLAEFVDLHPRRISGSEILEKGIDWAMSEMKKDGFDSVYKQPVLVPKWVRGMEYVEISSPVKRRIPMLGLGGSVATPKKGIEAEVVVFKSLNELKENPLKAKGKIVLLTEKFETYGKTVAIRSQGASESAKAGALATLIRSVASYSMQTPHTGGLRYAENVEKIPAAAITTEDAEWIERAIERGEKVKVKLYMEAKFEKDALSHNLVAEWRGTEKPDEVVVLGGHIDAWDVGQGAMDDGGGCIAAWEVLKVMKELNLRAKRTIRVVLWTNEENGLRGGTAYKDSVLKYIDKHVAAIESDAGVFKATGFGFGGNEANMPLLKEIEKLLLPIGSNSITMGGGGADIGPLMKEGVPGFGLDVNREKYFWYHHTEADTIDKLDPYELNTCVATMAVLSYILADMPGTLIR